MCRKENDWTRRTGPSRNWAAVVAAEASGDLKGDLGTGYSSELSQLKQGKSGLSILLWPAMEWRLPPGAALWLKAGPGEDSAGSQHCSSWGSELLGPAGEHEWGTTASTSVDFQRVETRLTEF